MFDFSLNKTKQGLGIITAPLRDTKTITILVMIKTGSRYEQAEVSGISHFLEHMFFKGSKKYPSAFKLASALDALGADYNAFTGKEYTGFWVKSASQHRSKIVEILASMLQDPLLNEAETEREKGVIIEEMNMYQDTPMSHINDIFEELLYGDTPQGRFIIGNKQTVKNLNVKKLGVYLKQQYSLENTLIFASGDFADKTLLSDIESNFNQIKSSQGIKKIPAIIKQTKPRLKIINKATDQTHIKLGFPGLPAGSGEIYILGALLVVLGGNMSSRLFMKIREKMGLAYYISASNESYSDTGYAAIRAGINHKKIRPAIEAILGEIKLLKDKGVSDSELSRAKEYLKGKLLLNLETSSDIAFWLGEQLVVKNKIVKPERILEKIDRITTKQIKELACQIFLANQVNLALIGPFDNNEEFAEVLSKYET